MLEKVVKQKTLYIVNGRKKCEQLGHLTCNCHGTCFNQLHVKMHLLYFKSGVMDAQESS